MKIPKIAQNMSRRKKIIVVSCIISLLLFAGFLAFRPDNNTRVRFEAIDTLGNIVSSFSVSLFQGLPYGKAVASCHTDSGSCEVRLPQGNYSGSVVTNESGNAFALTVQSTDMLYTLTLPPYSTYVQPGSMVSSSAYVITTDGSGNYFSRDGLTGAVSSSTNFSALLTPLILQESTTGGAIAIKGPGPYTVTSSLPVRWNVTINCDMRVRLQSTNIAIFNGSGGNYYGFSINGCDFHNLGSSGVALSMGTLVSSTFSNIRISGDWTYGFALWNTGGFGSGYVTLRNVDVIRDHSGGSIGIVLAVNGGINYLFDGTFLGVRSEYYGVACWSIYGDRNAFINTVAFSCPTGYSVTGGYSNSWISPLLETLTTGFSLTGPTHGTMILNADTSGVTTFMSNSVDVHLVYSVWGATTPVMYVSYNVNLNGYSLYGVGGISGSSTPSKNLRGSAIIGGTNTTATVTFGTNETDASYFVYCTIDATTGSPAAGAFNCYVTSRAVNGFTLNVVAAPGVGNQVLIAWLLVR